MSQLCVIFHVRMVFVLQMTPATVLLDTKEKDILSRVGFVIGFVLLSTRMIEWTKHYIR